MTQSVANLSTNNKFEVDKVANKKIILSLKLKMNFDK